VVWVAIDSLQHEAQNEIMESMHFAITKFSLFYLFGVK